MRALSLPSETETCPLQFAKRVEVHRGQLLADGEVIHEVYGICEHSEETPDSEGGYYADMD